MEEIDLKIGDEVYIKWTNKWSKIIRINQFLFESDFLMSLNIAPFVVVEYYTSENKNSLSGYWRNRLVSKNDYRAWNRKRIARRVK